MIRSVIFDYGMVLSLDQDRAHKQQLLELSQLDEATFDQKYWAHRDPYDQGLISGKEYWQHVLSEQTLSDADIASLIQIDCQSWSNRNETPWSWVTFLKSKGFKVGLLSNMGHDFMNVLKQDYQWLDEFDYTIFSCEIQEIKPEEPIYWNCLQGLGIQPQDAVFLDDRPQNIDTAHKIGMYGVVFETAQQAGAQLNEQHGLELPF